MTGRRSAAVRVALLALALVTASCGQAAAPVSTNCRFARGRPLADDIHRPTSVILKRARKILRRAARGDGHSGVHEVLAGSRYRIEDAGPWQLNDKPGYRRQFRIIGAMFDLAVTPAHPVDAVVAATGLPWPRRSPNHRYSRRYGYVEYRAHFAARSLTDVSVLVDVRRRSVVEVGPGPDGHATQYHPVKGHCPLRPSSPD